MAKKEKAQDTDRDKYLLWKARLDQADKYFEQFEKQGDKIVDRYRDKRISVENRRRRFNILYSNVQTLIPALYGRKAKPEVSRRFKDADPVGRTASMMLERCLEYEVEQYPDFDNTMRNSVEDRLLPGRGVGWIRYEPHTGLEATVSDDVDANVETLDYECAPTDYVYWKDFRHSPARTWEEVWWVSRDVYMTRDEGVNRFGENFSVIPLNAEPEQKVEKDGQKETEDKKAKVTEIWCKTTGKVTWLATDFPLLLDELDDPLELDCFYPCPKPLLATTTTNSLIPVADYLEYQDQAEEIDLLTQRIFMLTRALKVVGVYNAEYKSLQRVLNEGVDNSMLPVDAWAAFAEKGGLKGAMEFIPITEVMEVLERLYAARDAAKQVIYEITGIADIIRGATDAGETATAQQIKANFAGLRLKKLQQDVAEYATALLKLKAQVICGKFSPETIVQISGVDMTADAQHAVAALQLLKSDYRNFRIEVEADSLAQIDEATEKAEAQEFITAIGGMLKEAVPLVQASPKMGGLVGKLIMFAVRKMRAGRAVEADFEKAIEAIEQEAATPKPPPPDPAMEKVMAQAAADKERLQADMQADSARLQADAVMEKMRATTDAQIEAMRLQMETRAAEQQAMIDAQQAQHQSMLDMALERFKAQLQAETAIEVAEIGADASEKTAQISARNKGDS